MPIVDFNLIGVSPKNLSFGESYINNYRDLVIADGATYFPNPGGYEYGKLKQIGIEFDASLIMVPSAVKVSTLFNVKPTGLDFTVVRAGNASYVDEDGVILTAAANVARVDFTNGEAELLLEPASTNLIPRSEEFDDASWIKTNVSISADSIISPDGTLNADQLVENSSNATHIIRKSITYSAGIATISCFIKPGTGSDRNVGLSFNSDVVGALFNPLDGSVVATIGIPVDLGFETYINGWIRVFVTATVSAGAQDTRIYLGNGTSWTSPYLGDGVSNAFIFGSQSEQGNLTSYIPTVASTVLRNADQANNAGDVNTFNSEEGVLYAETAVLADNLTFRMIAISDGTFSNRVMLRYGTTSNQIEALIIRSGATVASMSFVSPDITQFSKIAIKYKKNDFALWVNGVEVDTDTSGLIFSPDTLTELSFDQGDGGSDFYGRTRNLQVFKRVLTDEEFTKLTTL